MAKEPKPDWKPVIRPNPGETNKNSKPLPPPIRPERPRG